MSNSYVNYLYWKYFSINMKLVIITYYWINSDGGGIREYTKNFVYGLKKIGIKTKVIFIKGRDSSNYKVSYEGLKFILKTLKILRAEKPDVILSQGVWYTEIPPLIYKIFNFKLKTFILFHTQQPKKFRFVKRLVYQFIINHYDKIGFVSKALEKNVQSVAGLKIKKDVFILYAGAKIKEPATSEIGEFKNKFEIPKNIPILLGLGLTAVKYKAEGAKLLIDAVKILKDKGKKVILILTREGKFSQMLREYAKYIGVSDSVIFTGDVENPFVPLALCDIYTHISLGEGLPIALLEAMAMGKPIIATPVGGIPEAIENGKNGILVEPDANKISKQIEKLVNNKEMRMRLAKNAKSTAQEKFTWDNTAKNFLKML